MAASDDVCTGLQLVNFLQDVPRDLALGRIYLPAEDRRRFGVTVLDVPERAAGSLLRFEAERARGLLAAGPTLREQIGGRLGRAVGLFARGGLAALDALEHAGWDIFTQRPRPSRLRLAREALAAMNVEQAYAEVQRLTRARARNFAWGIMLLPKPKRRAIAAIYAFAREVDDIADGDAPADEKRVRLGGAASAHRRAARRRGDVGRAGRRADALPDPRAGAARPRRRRAAWTSTGSATTPSTSCAGTARHVAGAVGVACIGVYGADQPQRAEALGIALQLINIMRDVREDWQLGRVYLPQDELASFGVSEEDIAAGRLTPAWQALMAYQSARARGYLEEGLTLLDYLDGRSAACVGTFAGLYRATLERIEAAASTSSTGRRACRRSTKLRIVGSEVSCLEGRGRRRRAGRTGGRARAGRRGPRGRPARGAADAGRRRADPARARGRSAAAARQRPAHRAGLFHGVPAVRRRGSARRARSGASRCALPGDRRARAGRRRSGPGCGCSRTRTFRSGARIRVARGTLDAGSDPGVHADETFADVLRGAATRRRDRPLLGRVHPAGAEPAARRGRCRLRDLHRADGAARPARAQRPAAPGGAARRDARGRCRPGAGSGWPSAARARGSSRWTSSTPTRSSSPLPPAEAARLLGEEPPALEDSPIVSVHLLFDRPLLRTRLLRCSTRPRTGCSTEAP